MVGWLGGRLTGTRGRPIRHDYCFFFFCISFLIAMDRVFRSKPDLVLVSIVRSWDLQETSSQFSSLPFFKSIQ